MAQDRDEQLVSQSVDGDDNLLGRDAESTRVEEDDTSGFRRWSGLSKQDDEDDTEGHGFQLQSKPPLPPAK